MLKIQKSRAMTRYVEARRQASHSGKSGYVSQTSKGSKPLPYSFIEESASNLYPTARPYIPDYARKYTDSYYDLRNEKYKYWYDKWGKPHINKWWRRQLDETLRLKKAYENVYNKRNTRSFNNGRISIPRYRGPIRNRKSFHTCKRVCNNKYSTTRQRQNCRCRSPHRTNYHRYGYKQSYR